MDRNSENHKEKFEKFKGVIRSHTSKKYRQCNGQKNTDIGTNNDSATRAQRKNRGELGCRSCSTSGYE